jgi:hypothetical protein
MCAVPSVPGNASSTTQRMQGNAPCRRAEFKYQPGTGQQQRTGSLPARLDLGQGWAWNQASQTGPARFKHTQDRKHLSAVTPDLQQVYSSNAWLHAHAAGWVAF